MIQSATKMAAVVAASRRSAAAAARQMRWKSSSSSSFSSFAEYVPESVRESVKSAALEEASRPDSSLWAEEGSANGAGRHGHGHGHINGQQHFVVNGRRQVNGAVNGHHGHRETAAKTTTSPRPIAGGSVDEPISSLADPLDEWHLNRTPRFFASECRTPSPPRGVQHSDPFDLSKEEMKSLAADIRRDLIGSDHPVLTRAASYFFDENNAASGGKKVRPMMVLLLSRAVASAAAAQSEGGTYDGAAAAASMATAPSPLLWQRPDLHAAQRRLAQISEMIHTASLFHDDVIDGADTRRGAPAVHRAFGNKMAILAGDYLLARASVCLARLRDPEVVECMSTVIEHLVRGEVMQMKGEGGEGDGAKDGRTHAEERMAYYLRKNFYKTASLMANSCKSAALLGNYSPDVVDAAYRYGKHLGVSFQLVDDVLDFDGSASTMGKAALSDLNSGLATAPVLFAAEAYPEEMNPLIERKFRGEGDVCAAVEVLRRSDGIERTKELARVHADLAIEAAMELGGRGYAEEGGGEGEEEGSFAPGSAYRDSLVHLAYKVVDRVR